MFHAVLYDAQGDAVCSCTHVNREDLQATAAAMKLRVLEVDEPVDLSNRPAYVQGKTLKPKLDYTLEQLPLPCTLTIEGASYYCTQQPVFEFDAPGTYTISVKAGPQFLEKVFEYAYQP